MKKILIIEDDINFAELLSDIFVQEGYETTIVSSGQQAINFIQSQKPDIITLDIDLPDMKGFEILNKLNGELDFIKVIVISSLDHYKNTCLNYKVKNFFNKPVDFKLLKKVIS